MNFEPDAFSQWMALARTLFIVPDELEADLKVRWASGDLDMRRVADDFYRDLYSSRFGYAVHPVSRTPYQEERLISYFNSDVELRNCERRPARFTLCLSHDVDHLQSTWRLMLKRLVGRASRAFISPGTSFLSSLEKLLAIDAAVSGRRGTATVFIANPIRATNLIVRSKQWLLDPTYDVHHPLFSELVALLKDYQCTVGLHGSFFSLTDDLLKAEKASLDERLPEPVTVSRQHWLNLPVRDSFQQLAAAGFVTDTTIGWNGDVGYRCGMARPFPILLADGRTLLEVPMPLMDGSIFDALKLTNDEAFRVGAAMIDDAATRCGTIALNWHERAVFYGWENVYQRLLDYALAKGARFAALSELRMGT